VGLKGSRIEQALRLKLTPANRAALQEYAQSLPEANPAEEESAGEAAGAESQTAAAQVAGTKPMMLGDTLDLQVDDHDGR
jgi:hypothetical protein